MTQSAPAFQAITLAIADDIAQLTLNRPASLNALNAEMFQEIPQAIEQASLAGARALLITGAGRGFCSGADLVGRPFAPEVSEAQRIAINRAGFEKVITLVRALNEAPMPVVCAICLSELVTSSAAVESRPLVGSSR
jgi:2-(1,2-epoxy-1,2-dihydrophenyl)acetyl-CoA isomerase